MTDGSFTLCGNARNAPSVPDSCLRFDESVTTFLSSHDSHEIRSLCDEISVIAGGRLVYTGATRDLGADLDAFERV
jgi:ABC-type Na+ transport system ATPase subunit NatA